MYFVSVDSKRDTLKIQAAREIHVNVTLFIHTLLLPFYHSEHRHREKSRTERRAHASQSAQGMMDVKDENRWLKTKLKVL